MKRTGFTLVELMVVVAILGVLMTIAAMSFRYFLLKSYQSEPKAALGGMMHQVRSFTDTNGGIITTSLACSMMNEVIGCELVVPNLGDPGCNIDNVFGIEIPNCSKNNYVYSYTTDGGSRYAVLAMSLGTLMNCGVNGLDTWALNDCGNLIHGRNIDANCNSVDTTGGAANWWAICP